MRIRWYHLLLAAVFVGGVVVLGTSREQTTSEAYEREYPGYGNKPLLQDLLVERRILPREFVWRGWPWTPKFGFFSDVHVGIGRIYEYREADRLVRFQPIFQNPRFSRELQKDLMVIETETQTWVTQISRPESSILSHYEDVYYLPSASGHIEFVTSSSLSLGLVLRLDMDAQTLTSQSVEDAIARAHREPGVVEVEDYPHLFGAICDVSTIYVREFAERYWGRSCQ